MIIMGKEMQFITYGLRVSDTPPPPKKKKKKKKGDKEGFRMKTIMNVGSHHGA